MLIFGHPWIPSASFSKVFSIKDILKVSSQNILLLEPLSDSIELVHYCTQNSLKFAITVNTVTEAIFANALKSHYIICQISDVAKIQPIAQEYLFDSKILTLINHEKEISRVLEYFIDGVIFPQAIILE